jgi:hypothetical protein
VVEHAKVEVARVGALLVAAAHQDVPDGCVDDGVAKREEALRDEHDL